jgi:hypothetical protein
MFDIIRDREGQHLPPVLVRRVVMILTAVMAVAVWSGLPASMPVGEDAKAQAPPPFVPAQPARTFGDSIGVNTHIGWSDTPAYSNFNAVLARMRELGVRYVRDGLCPTCEEWISRLKRLGAAGIRSNIISTDLVAGSVRMQQNLQVIRSRLRDAVVSVEAPNEPDQQGDSQWIAKTRALQQQLWASVKGDPALAHLQVLGPALVYPASWSQLGDLTAFLDRGNMHPYPGGGTPLHNLGDLIPLSARTSGGEPIVATEAGYHSDLATTSGHYGTSERAIGIYTPRLALEGFSRGLDRTYIYQLADPWTNVSGFENKFGLLRPDLSPKPAFLALRNLLRAVDGGSAPVAAPGGLRVGLEGAPPDLRQLLLRSANGTFALVLWRDVSVWDRVARQDLFPAADPLDVVLGQPIALARRFDPVESDSERQRWISPARIPVAVGGSPVVLRLDPPGAAGAPGTTTKGLRTGGSARGRCAATLGAVDSSRKARAKCCRAAHKAKRKRGATRRLRGRRGAVWALSAGCSTKPRR